jgi:hypothetical protein
MNGLAQNTLTTLWLLGLGLALGIMHESVFLFSPIHWWFRKTITLDYSPRFGSKLFFCRGVGF